MGSSIMRHLPLDAGKTAMSLRVFPLFSVPFGEVRHPEPAPLCDALRTLFLEREREGARYRNHLSRDTQAGLFESRFDLHTWPDAPVQQVFGFIHHGLASIIQETNRYTPEQYAKLSFNYHSWFHVTRKGGHQGVHNHPMASWSGIFCVDPGDSPADRPESGTVRFMDTRAGADMYLDSGNGNLQGQYHMGGWQVRHEAGRLVFFPSYVMHEVFPYWGERPRIIIAFNAWINGVDPPSGRREA